MSASPPFFVALDLPAPAEALAMAEALRPVTRRFKVGLELYTAGGPDLVRALAEAGDEVFLDLKLHDIPRTVARATAAAARLGVSWLTVHAAGGRAMLEQAVEAAEESSGGRLKLLGVTVLTSLDDGDLAEVGVGGGAEVQVERLARLAADCSVGGLVCSPREAAGLRAGLGPEIVLVCPGVRPAGTEAGDQKRIATPGEALEAGASLLVIGRPITRAEDPAAAARAISAGLEGQG